MTAPRRRLLAGAIAAALLAPATALAAGPTITAGPQGPTNDDTPTFAFTAAADARCAVDGADPAPCASPVTLDALPDGSHVFEIEDGDGRAARSFRVDTVAPRVDVADGDEVSPESTVSVAFTAEDGAATTCAVDDGPATACTSPFRAADLPNGTHAIAVTATDAAGNAGRDARVVRVEAQPPQTTISGGPEGDTEVAAPVFGLVADRPRSRFFCSLDGGPVTDCPARWELPELAKGAHHVSVRAVDAAGNIDPTPAERAFRVVACRRTVRIGAVAVAAPCLREQADGTLLATGAIRVNGITLSPRGEGGRAADTVIDPDGRRITLKDIQLRMGSIVLYQGDFDLPIPEADRFTLARIDLTTRSRLDVPPDDSEAALDLVGDDDASVAGFPLRGEARLDVVDGRTELTATIELPKVFTDAEGNGLTGTVTVSADNDRGVRLDQAQVTAPLAFLGSVELHDLYVRFVDDLDGRAAPTCSAPSPGLRWEGGASAIVLPTPGRTRIEDVAVGFADGRLSHASGAWKAADDAGADLGGGVRLQRLGVSLCTGPPLKLAGRAAFTALPGADGTPRLTVPDAGLVFTAGDPWTIRAEAPEARLLAGAVPVEFSDLFVQVNAAGAVDFGGGVRFALGAKGNVGVGDLDAVVKVDAKASGFLDGSRFNAELEATGCFSGTLTVGVPVPFSDICPKVEGVVSSTGVAVCGSLRVGATDLGRIGAGLRWGGALRFMTSSCDVGDWRVAHAATAASLRAAGGTGGPWARAAAAGEQFSIRGGRRGVLVAVRGADHAPRVTLRGPDGTTVTTPADPAGHVSTADALAFSNTATRTTYVALRRPAGGTWSAVAADGTERIRSIAAADLLAPATVRAGVRGRGHRRVLRYQVGPKAGQRVTLLERARGVVRVLRVVRGGGRGVVRFSPADGPGGPRRIEALVEQDGLPRVRRTVARYTAPARRRPARPHGVRVHRSGEAVRVGWRPAARAARYGVRVAVSDGRRLFFVRDRTHRAVRVAGVDRRDDVRVRVVGLRTDNGAGPAGAARSTVSRSSR